MKPEVSVVLITRNRGEELQQCINSVLMQRGVSLELLIVDNGSTDETANLLENINDPRIKLLPSKINLGVCGGRNRAFRHVSGEAVVVIDDDAEFLDADACGRVVNYFSRNANVGAISFRIVDYNSGKVDRRFFPSKRKKRNPNSEFETSWVIGAGHAIRGKALKQTGLYRDFRPYGSEEFDFSLRLINAGWSIIYVPRISILHRESPKARIKGDASIALKLHHRLRAAFLNLPFPVFLIFVFLRSMIAFVRSGMRGAAIFQAFTDLYKDLCQLSSRRSPVSWSTVWRLIKLNGPVFF